MTIEKELNDGKLVFKLAGSLDTTTAPNLEKEVNNLEEGIKELVFDFENLKYVSSAGLRVILITQKKAHNFKFYLTHVSTDVKEVLDMTGFSEFVKIVG